MPLELRWPFVGLMLVCLGQGVEAMLHLATNREWYLGGSSCVPLMNHGSHSTVQLNVGTPSQQFDLVADTGSNALIVSSCFCLEKGNCHHQSKCFRGTKSSTFKFNNTDGNGPPMTVLSYGSGQIEVAYTSDIVQLDSVTASMDNALMLMVNHRLQIPGPFEGILGLGLPQEQEYGLGKGFLERANIGQFSVCLNENADGVLRFNMPLNSRRLGSLGKFHWGLGLEGISVNRSNSPVRFCSKEDRMEAGQDTPCGAIPDSGTTLMMGPPLQLMQLFSDICDDWARCRDAASRQKVEKYKVFQMLLYQCRDWLMDGDGLDELPPLHFHLLGAGGKREALELPATMYVLETHKRSFESFMERTPQIFGSTVKRLPDEVDEICIPAFGELEMTTQVNGPVWILGTPLFYQYQVGYDLEARPPAISFSKDPCGSCPEGVDLFSLKVGAAWRPRKFQGPPRLPSLSLNRSRAM